MTLTLTVHRCHDLQRALFAKANREPTPPASAPAAAPAPAPDVKEPSAAVGADGTEREPVRPAFLAVCPCPGAGEQGRRFPEMRAPGRWACWGLIEGTLHHGVLQSTQAKWGGRGVVLQCPPGTTPIIN